MGLSRPITTDVPIVMCTTEITARIRDLYCEHKLMQEIRTTLICGGILVDFAGVARRYSQPLVQNVRSGWLQVGMTILARQSLAQ